MRCIKLIFSSKYHNDKADSFINCIRKAAWDENHEKEVDKNLVLFRLKT